MSIQIPKPGAKNDSGDRGSIGGAFILAFVFALVLAALVLPTGPIEAQIPGPSSQAIQCNDHDFISTTTNGTVEIIPATSGQRVFICGFILQSATATTGRLVSGTGTNCAANTTNLTSLYSFTTTPHQVGFGSGVGTVIRADTSHAVCIVNTSTNLLNGHLAWGKFR